MPKHMKATYYAPPTRVFVLLPGDPHTGQRGVVVSTRNDAGDMWHRVQFADGATADYLAEELAAAEGTSTNSQNRTGS
ncbi:hypothetical protein [Mycobacterium shimoidei]|uniref:hypothetical protein n=1 Tax=Mycobacterium shimoidei TaxID=29313 RepID=UPI000848E1DB|nr:hypothetical protein [Mycobacterium shimoidei]MCV7259196.1 hypothetical protein [Mycobacterium shimoidei]ODR05495.1 hypothetical protein BHQ16_22110 [Mycobacterium shimoidei]ORW79595.1 hypothetical protein AWC26_14335 [Mycobacterium shimoidei]